MGERKCAPRHEVGHLSHVWAVAQVAGGGRKADWERLSAEGGGWTARKRRDRRTDGGGEEDEERGRDTESGEDDEEDDDDKGDDTQLMVSPFFFSVSFEIPVDAARVPGMHGAGDSARGRGSGWC